MKAALLLALALVPSLAGCAGVDAAAPVTLYGRVDSRMADQVRSALAAGHRDFTIEGPGGYALIAAIIVGELRRADARLVVSGLCQSACALLVIGAPHRCVGPSAELQMHRATAPGWSEAEAIAFTASFAQGMGTPPDIARRTNTINLRPLTADELQRMNIGRCGAPP